MHAEDNATEAEEDFREKENEYLHRISILEREVIKSYLKNRQLVARRGAPVSRHEPAELAFMRMGTHPIITGTIKSESTHKRREHGVSTARMASISSLGDSENSVAVEVLGIWLHFVFK